MPKFTFCSTDNGRIVWHCAEYDNGQEDPTAIERQHLALYTMSSNHDEPRQLLLPEYRGPLAVPSSYIPIHPVHSGVPLPLIDLHSDDFISLH